MEKIKKHLLDGLNKGLIDTNNSMIDNLLSICNSYYNTPVHNLTEMKMRNQKIKGDIFECFAQHYLKTCYGLKDVWLLNEVPKDVLKRLNLKHYDLGIDLIGRDENNHYYAIQAKFRKKNKNTKSSLNWKTLSTFYALSARTGPFKEYIVITTADYVRRIGKKTEKDVTIGYHKLSKINHFQWLEIIGNLGDIKISNKVVESQELSIAELREKRINFYQ